MRAGAHRPDRSRYFAFTLVELLVVLAIIAILIAMLLPVLKRARDQGNLTVCLSNLRQIGAGLEMYANDHRGKFPDSIATGNFSYRMKPGVKTANDPAALPETYGLAALLHGIAPQQDLSKGLPRPKYIAGDSPVWICPTQPPHLADHGNTYAFAIRNDITTAFRRKNPGTLVVWDNFTLRPGLSGFRGPFSGYVLPVAQRGYMHPSPAKGTQRAVAELYVGGHVGLRTIN